MSNFPDLDRLEQRVQEIEKKVLNGLPSLQALLQHLFARQLKTALAGYTYYDFSYTEMPVRAQVQKPSWKGGNIEIYFDCNDAIYPWKLIPRQIDVQETKFEDLDLAIEEIKQATLRHLLGQEGLM